MPFVTSRRRAPARSRRRVNPFTSRTARKAALIRWGKAPKRKATRKVAKGRRFGIHRPRLRWGKRGWMAVPHGSVKRGTRINRRRRRTYRRRHNPVSVMNPIRRHRRRYVRHNTVARYNPRRHYRHHRRHYRHNPARHGIFGMLTSKTVINTGLTIGGGLIAGSITMPLVYRFLPAQIKQYNNYLGILNVALGALLFGFIKNKTVKQIGLVIAGTGVYDLIAMNVTQLGLPALPRVSPVIDQLLGPQASAVAAPVSASYPIARRPVSAAARIGTPFASSYEMPFGASYQAPGMPIEGFGHDNPYAGIEGWE